MLPPGMTSDQGAAEKWQTAYGPVVLRVAALSVFLILTTGCAWPWHFKFLNRTHSEDYARLQADHQRLAGENARLQKEVRHQSQLNMRYRSLVELQDRVLQLLDDRNNTVKTMISEVARKQNLIFKAADTQQTQVSFSEHDLFAGADPHLSPKGRSILSRLCAELEQREIQSVIIEHHGSFTNNNRKISGPDATDPPLSIIRAAAVAKHLSAELALPDGPTVYCSHILNGPRSGAAQGRTASEAHRIDILIELKQ